MPTYNDYTNYLNGTLTATNGTYTTAGTFDPLYRPFATTDIANDIYVDYKNAVLADRQQIDIDKLASKIYRIFSEHIKIDISEEDFLKLIKEEE